MVMTLETERHIFFTQISTAAFMLDAVVMTVGGPGAPSQEVALSSARSCWEEKGGFGTLRCEL